MKVCQILDVCLWFPPGTPVSPPVKLTFHHHHHSLDMTLAVAASVRPQYIFFFFFWGGGGILPGTMFGLRRSPTETRGNNSDTVLLFNGQQW